MKWIFQAYDGSRPRKKYINQDTLLIREEAEQSRYTLPTKRALCLKSTLIEANINDRIPTWNFWVPEDTLSQSAS